MNYRKKLVDYGLKMYKSGLVAGTSGNISIKENDDSYYITPSSMAYDKISEKDIVRIHKDGKAYDSNQRPSSEWQMHIAIYEAYDKYKAIVHTHSTIATAFAVARVDIPLILIEMKPFLGGEIKVAPFAPAGSKNLGQAIIPYLDEANSCLLANHGEVSCGKSLEEAYIAAEYVEDAAKIYYHALQIGKPFVLER